MSNDKQRYQVRDGYSFLYVPEVVDGEGKKYNFAKAKPARAGEIIEVVEMQTRGQEHKLELAKAVVVACNNTGCGKKFDTKAANIAYGFCPHCGGRGGKILGVFGEVKTDPVEDKPKPDADRMERARDKARLTKDDIPVDPEAPLLDPDEAPDPSTEPPKKKKNGRKRRK